MAEKSNKASTATSSEQNSLPSKALTEAFAEYEAQLLRTADKRLKGRQSAIRYNRRRFAHALKRIQSAKVIVVAREDDENKDDEGVNATTISTDATTNTTTTIPYTTSEKAEIASVRQDCLRRLAAVTDDVSKMRTILRDAKNADEMLERIRRDPRRRKIDVGVEEIVKELDDIESHCRRGQTKPKTTKT